MAAGSLHRTPVDLSAIAIGGVFRQAAGLRIPLGDHSAREIDMDRDGGGPRRIEVDHGRLHADGAGGVALDALRVEPVDEAGEIGRRRKRSPGTGAPVSPATEVKVPHSWTIRAAGGTVSPAKTGNSKTARWRISGAWIPPCCPSDEARRRSVNRESDFVGLNPYLEHDRSPDRNRRWRRVGRAAVRSLRTRGPT